MSLLPSIRRVGSRAILTLALRSTARTGAIWLVLAAAVRVRASSFTIVGVVTLWLQLLFAWFVAAVGIVLWVRIQADRRSESDSKP